MPINKKYFSVIILIAVNLFPIIGVIYFGWDIFEIVILYVLETFLTGIINAFKMMFIKGGQKFIMIPFFLFHYNFFIIVQTVFVVILLGTGDKVSFIDGGGIEKLVATFSKKDVLITVGGLGISHLVSFYQNFYKKKLFEKKQLGYFFAAPYKRIFVQQFVVIFGAWIGLLFDTPIVYLILLVFFKIAIDLRSHMKMNEINKKKPVYSQV